MKIFSWLRNKRYGKEVSNNKPNQEPLTHPVKRQTHKEEFSDWPNGLLTIGTFGNNKHCDKLSIQGTLIPSTQVENSTPEENEELDKELTVLLNKHIFSCESENKHNLLVEKLLEWLIRKYGKKNVELSEQKDLSHRLQRTISVIQKEGKEILLDNNNNNNKSGISKKSLSFLFKKAFLCKGGFARNPILRDPLPDPPKLENSRLEKILRALLHKKIYPQKPAPKNSSKNYLDIAESDSDEEDYYEEGKNESKWVKTDSEYIVLEI